MSNLIESRLRERGGAARRAEIVQCRGDATRLADAVGRGIVRPVTRGVFALPGTPHDLVAAAVHNARPGCVSALALAGVAVLRPPDEPHLAVGRQRGRRPSTVRERFPVVIHREGAPADRTAPVSLASALARALVCRSGVEALVSVDSAVNRRLVSVAQVDAALPEDAVRARLALRLADGRSRSPLETVGVRAAAFHRRGRPPGAVADRRRGSFRPGASDPATRGTGVA